jgi:hypothetical protein
MATHDTYQLIVTNTLKYTREKLTGFRFQKALLRKRLGLISCYTEKPVEIIRNASVDNVRRCGTSLKKGFDSHDNRRISLD